MARKRYKPEEVVAKLRQVDVLVSYAGPEQSGRDPLTHVPARNDIQCPPHGQHQDVRESACGFSPIRYLHLRTPREPSEPRPQTV